jgi:hypothetical protein
MYDPRLLGLESVTKFKHATHLIKKATGIISLLGVLSARCPMTGNKRPVSIIEIIVICL